MRILLVHEFYRSSSPSGEDVAFERERDLLLRAGVDVDSLTFHNDFIGTRKGPSIVKTALMTSWSPVGRRIVRDAINRFMPDVVHFHNTFPVLSQSAIWEAKKCGAATVQTLHNYRWFCANALLLRKGRLCDVCLRRGPWLALRYRCYRDSFGATLPLVLNIAVNGVLKTPSRAVDQLVVLTPFARDLLIKAGLDKKIISIKPNFFMDPLDQKESKVQCHATLGHDWVFIGRLKEEKGVQFLPQVWEWLGSKAPVLRIIGDGPMKGFLTREIHAKGLDRKIFLEGYQQPETTQKLLKEAGLLVFPSICFEGFPLTVGEAYAAGVPVAASRIGAVASIVKEGQTGIFFEPGDIGDMANKLKGLIGDYRRLKSMGENARAEYEEQYTPSRNLALLLEIYEKALARRNMHSKFLLRLPCEQDH